MRYLRQFELALFAAAGLLLDTNLPAQDAPSGPARLQQLRAERDQLLQTANQAAASGDTARGDTLFARSREVNAMITALRAELAKADLAVRQAELTRKLGDLAAYQTHFQDPFLLIAPAHDAEFAKLFRYLPQADHALYSQLGCRNRPEKVTVLLAGADRAGLKKLWRQLSGQDDLPPPECPLPWRDGVVADMNLGPGQLLAGLTRAFVQTDFPEAPSWLILALASLNETSRIIISPADGRSTIEYAFNWRFAVLADAPSGTGPLTELFRGGTLNDQDPLTIARLRYWALWLNLRGWLRPWYEHFRDYRQLDPTGIRQLEQVSQSSLPDLLAEHETWRQRQRGEWRRQQPASNR